MKRIEIKYKEKGYYTLSQVEREFLALVKPTIERELTSLKLRNKKRKSLVIRLVSNLNTILIGKPLALENFVRRIKKSGLLNSLDDRKFSNRLSKIFNYKSFRGSVKKGVWLGNILSIKACLYCNSQFTLSLTKSKKLTYTFDHFFPQTKYPFLAVSMYNLIPCCNYCNQRKSKSEYLLDELISPHVESFDDILIFKTDPSSIINFISGKYKSNDLIQLKLEYKRTNPLINGTEKFKNQLFQFDLEDVYENHKDIVGEIYIKSKIYTPAFRKYLKAFNKYTAFLTDDQVDQLIVGNYVSNNDINRRPLTKLCQDISREARMIK